MSLESPNLYPGQKVEHRELGEGVVTGKEPTGYITVFFRAAGERRVPSESLSTGIAPYDKMVKSISPATPERLEKLWLALEAEEIPLMESAAALTSAKVDLLPHQVVLVHRIANTQPRRFLIADEVGLGKTIEIALILRELASRQELERAIMVVPAGLVENWRRELNDVFNLDFEVFGTEGDVTDRKTNAFARHNRLIVSIDTLKRRPRIKKLQEAPGWDLAVFDEAHHLSVYRTGHRVKKTENYNLAEVLRDHCRHLLLLSATPHQGDHFRFWMLTRLLNPDLFENPEDMVENRYRLNAVVIRRTKADACAPDGGPLFARRTVHTQGFELSHREKEFYTALLDYLRDGYNVAHQQGNRCRGLGFIMAIFQKIAASSFAAIRTTLQRRLLMLTIRESIERDELLDVDGRNLVLEEAREIIHEIYSLAFDRVGTAQVDQILAETKVKLLKKRKETPDFAQTVETYSDSELAAEDAEETATMMVSLALPQERQRIKELLKKYPGVVEAKTSLLAKALNQLWQQNPGEKIVIFATYLGTVDIIKRHLEVEFPGKGVEILKGGDHGSKTAALRRFRRKDGPRVLVSTAAGREGINLQFARILFNYDLPWNPMDLEQRIGRIHRYGQSCTAQVYNLVATDTIEGKIYLLLEEKIREIARTLGKLDENGQIAEDLRSQILGQLNGCLSYDRLYQEAILDPSLKRTEQELEVAMTNANLAREVVFELFQDLDRFNLGDYHKFDDEGRGMQRLISLVTRAVRLAGQEFKKEDESRWSLIREGKPPVYFTSDRDRALQDEKLELLGLEHTLISGIMQKCQELDGNSRALIGKLEGIPAGGVLTTWKIQAQNKDGHSTHHIIRLAIAADGNRAPWLEKLDSRLLEIQALDDTIVSKKFKEFTTNLESQINKMLHRELLYKGIITGEMSYSSTLLALLVIEN